MTPGPDVRLGKRVAHRSHGNAGPVTGDVADGILNGAKARVRACETPEFYARFGCPHRDGWERVVFTADEMVDESD